MASRTYTALDNEVAIVVRDTVVEPGGIIYVHPDDLPAVREMVERAARSEADGGEA